MEIRKTFHVEHIVMANETTQRCHDIEVQESKRESGSPTLVRRG